jgi:hypothetical protein
VRDRITCYFPLYLFLWNSIVKGLDKNCCAVVISRRTSMCSCQWLTWGGIIALAAVSVVFLISVKRYMIFFYERHCVIFWAWYIIINVNNTWRDTLNFSVYCWLAKNKRLLTSLATVFGGLVNCEVLPFFSTISIKKNLSCDSAGSHGGSC